MKESMAKDKWENEIIIPFKGDFIKIMIDVCIL